MLTLLARARVCLVWTDSTCDNATVYAPRGAPRTMSAHDLLRRGYVSEIIR